MGLDRAGPQPDPVLIRGFGSSGKSWRSTTRKKRMPDYYAILWRTLKTGDFDDPQWRNSVFDRTQQVLLDQLRAQRPPLSNNDIRVQTDALNAAIRTIQSEFAPAGIERRAPREVSSDSRPYDPDLAIQAWRFRLGDSRSRDTRPPRRERPAGRAVSGARTQTFQLNRVTLAGAAIVVATIAAGVYAFLPAHHDDAPPPAANKVIAEKPAAPAPAAKKEITEKQQHRRLRQKKKSWKNRRRRRPTSG